MNAGQRCGSLALLTVGLLTRPGLALAQPIGLPDEPGVSWWRVLGALLICLSLAAAAAFALRTRLRGPLAALGAPSERQLRLIESLRLSHQVDICLIGYGDKRVLLASTPHGAVLISVDPVVPNETPQG